MGISRRLWAKSGAILSSVSRRSAGRLRHLRDRDTLLTIVQSMNAKAGILQDVTWQDNGTHTMLHFLPNVQRLHHEVAMLKHYNVSVVISLLEQPWIRQPWRHTLRSIISQWRTSRRRPMSRCMPLRPSSYHTGSRGKRGDSLPSGRRTHHDYAASPPPWCRGIPGVNWSPGCRRVIHTSSSRASGGISPGTRKGHYQWPSASASAAKEM